MTVVKGTHTKTGTHSIIYWGHTNNWGQTQYISLGTHKEQLS